MSRWHRCLAGGALAAGLLLSVPLAAAQAIRLTAGAEAQIPAPGGTVGVRLGQPWTAPVPGLELSPAQPAAPIRQICCAPGVACLTERNVGIGTPRAEVIGRYGASWLASSTAQRLDYRGVSFSFDAAQRVQRICIGSP